MHSNTAVIAHGFWAHTLGLSPGPPRNRQTSQLALRRGASRTAPDLLCRTASDPSTTAWLNPMSLGSEIDNPHTKKKCPSRAQPPSFRDTSHRLHSRRFSLAQEQQRCARSNLCAVPVDLVLMTQGVWSSVQKLKKKRCDEGCTRVLLLHILSYNTCLLYTSPSPRD